MKDEYIHTGRTSQKLETRRKILAGAQHFLNRGLPFNLEDVARQSGVSRATVYRYYSNPDVLATEAGLDLNTKSPEAVIDGMEGESFEDKILGVQEYFNALGLAHETAFRKYLGTLLNSDTAEIRRGARRVKTLQLALKDSGFSADDRKTMAQLFTLLMGIEPLIIAKDVCGLDDTQAQALLRKGLTLMLRGMEVKDH